MLSTFNVTPQTEFPKSAAVLLAVKNTSGHKVIIKFSLPSSYIADQNVVVLG